MNAAAMISAEEMAAGLETIGYQRASPTSGLPTSACYMAHLARADVLRLTGIHSARKRALV